MEKYIKSLESLKEMQINDKYELEAWKASSINLITRIYGAESKQEEQIKSIKYASSGGFFISGPGGDYSSGGSNNISSCKKQSNHLIDGIIKDLQNFGLPKVGALKKDDGGINIAINQTQSVKQEISLNIIFKVLQDEITGKQLKEIQLILESDDEMNKKKGKLVEKLKSFGSDVATNIIAAILTNPSIYCN